MAPLISSPRTQSPSVERCPSKSPSTPALLYPGYKYSKKEELPFLLLVNEHAPLPLAPEAPDPQTPSALKSTQKLHRPSLFLLGGRRVPQAQAQAALLPEEPIFILFF